MQYDFLFDRASHLLAIGYNVDGRRRDTSYYDCWLRKLDYAVWSNLPGTITAGELVCPGAPARRSRWRAGPCFVERLDVRIPDAAAGHADLRATRCSTRPARRGGQRRSSTGGSAAVPWGMSESGYNTTDAHLNYQYRAFGVPGLGLKRGLADDLVIAPYASAHGADGGSRGGLRQSAAAGGGRIRGRYRLLRGDRLHPSRLPRGQSSAVVRSFMAHHQGMSFLSLAYLLLDRPMQRRFEADPSFQATTLLLQERIPKGYRVLSADGRGLRMRDRFRRHRRRVRARLQQPDTPLPEVQLAVQRPLSRDGHQRRRRLQPLEGTGRHALA